jgi:hypothetical protein
MPKTHRTRPFIFAMLVLIASGTLTAGCGELDASDDELRLQPIPPNDPVQAKDGETAANAQGVFALNIPHECENPCTFSVRTSLTIASVIYEADQWALGESFEANSEFSMAYTFNTMGLRKIRAIGLSAQNERIVEAERVIEIKAGAATTPDPRSDPPPQPDDTSASGRPDVPFFLQYNNRIHPAATCQNTSIAMVLSYLGWRGAPDDITERYGKDRAQSPAGLAAVFNAIARENGLSKLLKPNTGGTLSGLRAELDRGTPVIIHGYFTSYGHVVVVLGYDGDGYYVNDPAGQWSEAFMGGYRGRDAGKAVHYGKSAFEAAVATSNGYNRLPLWYHALRPSMSSAQ